jgi:hypothetical protein
MLNRIHKSDAEVKKMEYDMDAARIPTLSNETEQLVISQCIVANYKLNLLQDIVRAQMRNLQEVQSGNNLDFRLHLDKQINQLRTLDR